MAVRVMGKAVPPGQMEQHVRPAEGFIRIMDAENITGKLISPFVHALHTEICRGCFIAPVQQLPDNSTAQITIRTGHEDSHARLISVSGFISF